MEDNLQCCRREHLRTINLIMSLKSKEEIQLETMEYLISNKPMFQEFLKGVMCKTDVKSRDNIDSTPHSASVRNCVSHENTPVEDLAGNKPKTASGKKKISKYENVDFCHIYREPKNTKKKARRKKERKPSRHTSTRHALEQEINHGCKTMGDASLVRIESKTINDSVEGNKCHHTGDAVNLSPDDSTEDEMVARARLMIHALVHSKSKTEQDKVLEDLRSDDQLLQHFRKESSHIGKVKIPIFHKSKENIIQHSSNSANSQDGIPETNSLPGAFSLHVMQGVNEADELNSKPYEFGTESDSTIYNLNQFHLIQSSTAVYESSNVQESISTNELETHHINGFSNIDGASLDDDQAGSNFDSIIPEEAKANRLMTQIITSDQNDEIGNSIYDHIRQLDRSQYFQSNNLPDLNDVSSEELFNYSLAN